ncbi:XRE family transcriptional regulator [Halobacteriovorax sp. JY17]|uniref:XRE family transcriptional regulator n=1 Tax=Halobacteriovorax sp. JY17 TaxID=2014617 RepID=UPI000C4B394A|nr:XRE family transcriptional regulator [Halobacteriovorax sp. JY17]PIK14661.1 MAG: hypothetical protein CES88_09995 [Halobacteriovorax sp. JY17]
MENKTIAEVLAEHILNYKKEHPSLSSQQIAKKFGVTSSSFNRIERGDVSSPTIDQVVKILGGVGRHAEIVGYLNDYYPIISKTFRDFYVTEDGSNSGDKIKHFIQQKEFCVIILYSLVGNGVSRDEIKRVFGEVGESRLQHLIDHNVLAINTKGIIGKIDYYMDIGIEVVSKVACIALDECFKLVTKDYGYSRIDFKAKSVDKEKAMPKVVNILLKASEDIEKIVDSDEYKGDYPMFYVLCTDSLYPKIK